MAERISRPTCGTLYGDAIALAEFAARDAQHAADLAGERSKNEQAIAAFSSLAERLDALAAALEPRRPWWKRLAG